MNTLETWTGESPQLLSLTEAYVPRYCEGLPNEYCDDELDDDDPRLCKPCQLQLDKREREAALEKERKEEADQSQYAYLKYEDEERRLAQLVKLTEHIEVSVEEMKRRMI